jgi:hypothetical protein
MLLCLSCACIVQSNVAFGLWILLALAIIPAAWAARRHAPALWTLGGTFLLWAHGYFVPQWEGIQKSDPKWLFPAAVLMALIVLGVGLLVEWVARRKTQNWAVSKGTNADAWMVLLGVALLFGVADITALIWLRVELLYHYPVAAAIAVALVVLAGATRMTFSSVLGLAVLVVNAVIVMAHMAGGDMGKDTHFIAFAVLGVALTVIFERFFHAWSGTPLIRGQGGVRYELVVLIAIMTAMLLLLVHIAPWTAEQYETPAVGGVAVVLLGLGIAFKAALYRRFGLGVFVFALVRLYFIDLAKLETFYKIIAFIALGVALIVVSFLYSRFKEQFQKWV